LLIVDNNDAPSPVTVFQTLTACQHTGALKAVIELRLLEAVAKPISLTPTLSQKGRGSFFSIREKVRMRRVWRPHRSRKPLLKSLLINAPAPIEA
jgi:hypothetical protein